MRTLSRRALGGRWLGVLLLIVALAPPALVAWTVATAAIDVPYWDDWELVDLLGRARAGTLGFSELWTQHNEHRLVLPQLLMLALARATAWDPRATMAASVVFALATLGVLGVIIYRTLAASAAAFRPWVFVGASLLTFSMVAWQNWLWAWQVQIFMNVLAASAMAWALGRYGPRWPGPLLAAAAAVAGTLSFANGLALLVLLPIALALDPRGERAAWRRPLVLVVAALSVAVAAIYLAGFHRPPGHPSPLAALMHPINLALYVATYLGAPFAIGSRLALPGSVTGVITVSAVSGGIGVVIVIVGAVWIWRRRPTDRAALVPWLTLVLFATISATMTGTGRLEISLASAMASRYTTIAALFWISALAIAALAVGPMLQLNISRARAIAVLGGAVAIEVLAVVGYAASWAYGLRMADSHHDMVRRGAECLRFYRTAPGPCLALLYPDVGGLRERAARLEALRLGPFAARRTEQPLASYAVMQAAVPPGAIDFFGTDDTKTEFVLAGWGMDPATQRAAPAVLIVLDGAVIGRAVTGLKPGGLGNGVPANTAADAGWAFRFSVFRLGPGSHAIEAYAVLGPQQVAKLGGSRVIDVSAKRT